MGSSGDATVTKVGDSEFWIVSSGIAERYQKRFFNSVELPPETTFKAKQLICVASISPGLNLERCYKG